MKKTFLIIGILAVIGGGVGYYMYNKPLEDMASAKTDITLAATELFSAFEADEAAANAKFLDKKVQVTGKVLQVETDGEGIVGITLEAGGMLGGVLCKLDRLSEHKRTTFQEGEEVTFKGICTGILMDVVVERCIEL